MLHFCSDYLRTVTVFIITCYHVQCLWSYEAFLELLPFFLPNILVSSLKNIVGYKLERSVVIQFLT